MVGFCGKAPIYRTANAIFKHVYPDKNGYNFDCRDPRCGRVLLDEKTPGLFYQRPPEVSFLATPGGVYASAGFISSVYIYIN